jgi:hypothetical protein
MRNIIILKAEVDDIHNIELLIREFANEITLKDFQKHYHPKAVSNLIYRCILDECCWVAIDNGTVVGIIGGYITPNSFCLFAREMREAFWWVDEGHRDANVGRRLFDKYKEHIDWLLKNEEIMWSHMSTLENSPENATNLVEKYFRREDHTYIRDLGDIENG